MRNSPLGEHLGWVKEGTGDHVGEQIVPEDQEVLGAVADRLRF